MRIAAWSVKNRTVVLVVCLALTVGGMVSYVSLPLEAFPDVEIPFITVSTNYRGVSPLDVEKSITIKIENELKGLSGIRKLTSTSDEGSSFIVCEFESDVDMDEALRKVKDRVDRAKGSLPSDLDGDPEVYEISPAEFPVVTVVLSGPVGLPLLKKIAEGYQEEFESIPGVIEAEISGGLEREIIVEVDNDRAVGYNLPVTQVIDQISSENLSTSGGSMRMGGRRYQLRVPGEFETADDANRLVVAVVEGQPVYLEDVATVRDGFKEQMSRSRLNGAAAVMISVKKRSGGNIVELVDEVDRILEERRGMLPGGVTAVKINDMARFVRWLLKDLENNLLSGFLLVLAVVFLAMGFRNALLVSISIPLSMLISFVVLDMLGSSINMIVLFSMILSLGMLVDNAIVIVENIYRFMQAGVPRVQAAYRATAEVAWPIIGSTLTTIAAFAPLIFWPGMLGSVMRQLPQTVIITLMACLFVALVINPALAAIFMRRPAGAKQLASAEIEKAIERPSQLDTGILPYYRAVLRWCLKRRSAVLAGAVVVVVLCIQIWLLRVGLVKSKQLMSSVDPDTAHVQVKPPVGAGLDYNDVLLEEVERRIRGEAPSPGSPGDLVDIENVIARSSLRGGMAFGPGSTTPNSVTLSFRDIDERSASSRDTVEEVRRRIQGIAGAEISIQTEEMGPPTGAPVNVEVSGENLMALGKMAARIRRELEKVPFLTDVRDDYAPGVPTIRVRVDRKKAALVGLNTLAVGFALKVAINGISVSKYREMGEEYDITVRLSDEERNSIDTLRRFFIPTPSGQLVPLTSIADIVYEGGYASISRIDHRRTVTVRADVDASLIAESDAREEAEAQLAQFRRMLPPGYDVRFTGQFEFEKESQQFLGKAFLVVLFLIAIILVAIFNSVTQPLIIMTSVLLSTGGAFLGLAVAKLPFVIVMTGIGIISLAGVVVNNAIILVDYTNKLRRRGYPLDEAVVAAGATRLRPVLLTAITTILGLLPLVLGIAIDFREIALTSASASSQWWMPMAVCVIFGLGLATFLTLVVVPCLYHLIESARIGPAGGACGGSGNGAPSR